MRSLASLALALALAATACKDGGAAVADAGPDDMVDAATGPRDPQCAAGGGSHAVVVAINSDEDAVEVLELDGGQLVDHGLRFTGIVNPRDIAIRADGGEALVSFGGFGHPHGVAVLDLEGDGASASIRQTVEVGMDKSPYGLAYASDDRAVAAFAGGPSGHVVVGLTRDGDGDFAAGDPAPVPDDWPLALYRRPGADQVVLARRYTLEDDDTDLYLLGEDGGEWTPIGDGRAIGGGPLEFAVGPEGDAIYSATSDPEDPITEDNLDGGGLVRITPIADDGLGAQATIALPGLGGRVAIDPLGESLVVVSSLPSVDPKTETLTTYTSRFITIARADGELGEVSVGAPWPVLIVHGLAVAASGHLVMSRQLWDTQSLPSNRYPLDILRPQGDGGYETCSTRYLEGQGRVAVAP